jgi:hypothetical protein
MLHLALATCIALLAAGAAMAQFNTTLVAEVPFGFEANNNTLPAGEYQIKWHSNPAVMELRGGGKAILVLANSAYDRDNETPRLVFSRYGDKYFLSQIWSTEAIGRQVPMSRHEKELRAASGKPEAVIVATR